MAREMRVSSVAFSVSTHAEKPRGAAPARESGAWLDLEGTLNEPLRGVSSATLTLHLEAEWHRGTLGPPSIGGIIGLKPHIQCVIGVPNDDFDRVWLIASAGHLKFCHIAFTEPERRHAFIVSTSFSSRSEYEDDREIRSVEETQAP